MKIIGKHQGAVDDIVFDFTRNQIISAGRDGKIVAWSLTNNSAYIIYQPDKVQIGNIFHRLAIHGNTLVAAMTEGECIWVDLINNKIIKALKTLEYAITDIAIQANGLVAVAGDNDLIKLYNEVYSCIWEGKTYKFPYSVDFENINNKLLIASWDGKMYEVEINNLPKATINANGKVYSPLLNYLDFPTSGSPIFLAKYISKDKIILAGYSDYENESGFLHILNKRLNVFEHSFYPSEGIHSVAVSPSGQYLAAAGNNQVIWLWKLPNFEQVEKWDLGNEKLNIETLNSDEEFAQRLKRAGVDVKGFEEIDPTSFKKDTYYPAVLEFYHATGPYSVHTLTFHSDEQRLFAGTQNGEIIEINI